MRIILKEDWDNSVQAPGKPETGHFVGRDKEVSFLTNEIARRNQGAILVTGYRGVGKTSLVYKALRSLPEKNIIPVLINATHLEPETADDSSDVKYAKQVIINLIRRLYSSCTNAKYAPPKAVFRQIEKLYKKAVASEYKALAQEASSEDRKLEKIKSFESSIFSDKTNISIWTLSYTVAATIALIPLPNEFNWIKGLFSLLLAFPVPLGINIYRNSKSIDSITDVTKSTAEELYTMDNNVGNLAFDLEGIHRDLAQHNFKVIYMVDELDKMEDAGDGAYKKIFKMFKNLFTLSSAVFIFVGGEEVENYFSKSITPKSNGLYRSREYTYFNTKYFLSRPNDQDVSRFLNEIIENVSDSDFDDKSELFDAFKRFLIFSAQSDYFDLLQGIKDRITGFDGHNPILDITDLSNEELLKANLQKALSVLFNGKYRAQSPSKWKENENTIRELYDHTSQLAKTKLNTQVVDSRATDLTGAARRDLNYFCYRLKLLDFIAETTEDIDQTRIRVRTYKFNGSFRLDIPDQLDFQSEIEQKFVTDMKQFARFIYQADRLNHEFQSKTFLSESENDISIKSIDEGIGVLDKWGVKLPQWNELRPIYQTLRDEVPPYKYNREDIEAATQRALQAQDLLKSNTHRVMSYIIKEAYPELGLQIFTLNQDNNLFSGPLMAFRQEIINLPHFVVFDKEYKRQILVTSKISREILENHKTILRENNRNYLILFTELDDSKTKWNWKQGIALFSPIQDYGSVEFHNKLTSWLTISYREKQDQD